VQEQVDEEAATDEVKALEQQDEFQDEHAGPLVLRPTRDDIHAILAKACKLDLGTL